METGHQTISLNGTWDFVVDMDPKYHLDKRIYLHDEYAKIDIDRQHWLKVPVPGVWQKYAERYDIYEGVCWFAREFDVSEFNENSSALIRFSGVNYLCRVFLNGKEIGNHETGYTEFSFDITKNLRAGKNHIAVMVDNRAAITKWPPCLGYFNYGGIYRDVVIETRKKESLDNVVLDASINENGGLLKVCGEVTNPSTELSVAISCNNTNKTVTTSPDGTFECAIDVPGIEPWSPDNPKLYPVEVTLQKQNKTIDSIKEECGFRTIKMDGNAIKLNGENIRINGICYVYDSETHGLVMTDEQVAADLGQMKEMGCNLIRCHYPMDRHFYRACDKAGIMVWIEPNVYCLHPGDDETGTEFSDPEYRDPAKQMIVEMIANARNHPSVVMYGIGNECNTTNPEADDFFRMLAGTIRESDTSRLVSYAALYGRVGTVADIVDVLGINSYWGWYDKCFGGKGLSPEERAAQEQTEVEKEPIDLTEMRKMLDDVIEQAHDDVALLLTEFGADSLPGMFSESRELWSENYHADLLTEIFKLADEYPQIVGTSPFCFCDYRDPSKILNGYWNEINLKGVVGYDRKPKMAFDAIKSVYTKLD